MKRSEAVKAWGGAWSRNHPPYEWAMPDREGAEAVVKPDKPIRVVVMRVADYQRLLRAARPKRKAKARR